MTLPNSRLFLVVPGSGDIDLLADCFVAASAAGDVASLLITDGHSATSQLQSLAQRILPLAQSGDTAVLLEDNSELALKLGADGIEVNADVTRYRDCRAQLGTDLAIGANCGSDRHVAMEMAEAGVDYVRIDPFAPGPGDETLIAWWSQLFEIPCVTEQALTSDEITEAVRMGADFVRPDDAMWTSPKNAAEIVAQAMQAIEAARA